MKVYQCGSVSSENVGLDLVVGDFTIVALIGELREF